MKKISFQKAKDFLKKYDIPYVESIVVDSKKSALRTAKKIGWPVVLKTASSSVVHRTEKKGVVVGINSKKELKRAWKQISKLGQKAIMQPQVKGIEIIMGMKRDEQFGPVLMFGLGGIFVEILKDLCFRVAPIDREEARKMIKGIKGFELLKGVRGRQGADLDRLADILVKLSRLAVENENIEEVDFNPVIADPESALVVDARIIEK